MDDQENVRYECPKCGATKFRTGHFKAFEEEATSGIFNVQKRYTVKFYTVTCARCGFAELYEALGEKRQSLQDYIGND
jgi:predicted nucleic-acid-binding Zn-ribbon protein